jgi:hypothetical protein
MAVLIEVKDIKGEVYMINPAFIIKASKEKNRKGEFYRFFFVEGYWLDLSLGEMRRVGQICVNVEKRKGD